MKKSKPVGYIVVAPASGCSAYKLGNPDTDEAKSLWFGCDVTLFATRKRATRALTNTKKYREEHGYDWPWIDTSYVMAVYAE
jgi:hypothetical protein